MLAPKCPYSHEQQFTDDSKRPARQEAGEGRREAGGSKLWHRTSMIESLNTIRRVGNALPTLSLGRVRCVNPVWLSHKNLDRDRVVFQAESKKSINLLTKIQKFIQLGSSVQTVVLVEVQAFSIDLPPYQRSHFWAA